MDEYSAARSADVTMENLVTLGLRDELRLARSQLEDTTKELDRSRRKEEEASLRVESLEKDRSCLKRQLRTALEARADRMCNVAEGRGGGVPEAISKLYEALECLRTNDSRKSSRNQDDSRSSRVFVDDLRTVISSISGFAGGETSWIELNDESLISPDTFSERESDKYPAWSRSRSPKKEHRELSSITAMTDRDSFGELKVARATRGWHWNEYRDSRRGNSSFRQSRNESSWHGAILRSP
uniref:Uncharacterized protein n=1 Tax=Compsopogon caeruleus TaxID=31354 RepID=A0A7S1TIN5_9RHOD